MLTPINKSFVTLKVLIQNERTLMVHDANFMQCICTGYCDNCLSLPSFYYELLLLTSYCHKYIATNN